MAALQSFFLSRKHEATANAAQHRPTTVDTNVLRVVA